MGINVKNTNVIKG